MRPVCRGEAPRRRVRASDQRGELIERIGDFCSYCESREAAHVEHILPSKNKHEGLDRDWSNLLLSCGTCNSLKAKNQDATPHTDAAAARTRYLWPDQDNTARVFTYTEDGRVGVSPGLDDETAQRAEDTLKMLGLHKEAVSKPRWKCRWQAWTDIRAAYEDYVRRPDVEDHILLSARSVGYWSIWRAVFAKHPSFLLRLNERFAGTAEDCFDSTGALVPRPGGRC